MQDLEKLSEQIIKRLSKGRYRHVLGVSDTAGQLAEKHNADVYSARLAALLHDIAKEYKGHELLHIAEENEIPIGEHERAAPSLLHADVGAWIAQHEFGVEDQDVLQAIRSHTMGRANMSQLEVIIFLADATEPNRLASEAEPIRQAIQQQGLQAAVAVACRTAIEEVLRKGQVLHPRSVQTYNHYLQLASDQKIV